MNSEAIESQLILLLASQPERLANNKVTAELFGEPYDEIYLGLLKLFIDGLQVSLSAVIHLPGISEKAITTATALKAYDTPDISMEYAIDFLKEKSLRESFSAICREAYDKCHDRTIPINDSIAAFQAKSIGLVTQDSSYMQVGSSFASINETIEWRSRNPGALLGPSTGFNRLDLLFNGYQPKFYLIGARPSVGKTAFIGDLTRSLCSGNEKVLIFAAEMTADEYRERILAAMSGVNISAYRASPMSLVEMKNILQAQKVMKKWLWWINDNPDITIDEIEAHATAIVAKHGRVHIFVDYLQLVNIDSKKDRYEQIGMISGRLKKLSRRLKVSVTAAAQLKRVEGRFDKDLKRTVIPAPQLHDFRESGNLEQDADVAKLLHRDHIHDPENASVIIAKHRGGRCHPGIQMRYIEQITSFREINT